MLLVGSSSDSLMRRCSLLFAQALQPLPSPGPSGRDGTPPEPAVVVRPHALEEHVPALSGPALVRVPGDGEEGGTAAGFPDGPGAAGAERGAAGLLAAAGGHDCAVSLAALWYARRPIAARATPLVADGTASASA